MQIVVQILKVHPAGLEQHFFPLFGHQRSLGAAAVAKGNGEILFDEDELLLLVQNAAVSQAITVGAQIGADGVPARQLGAQRQGALRVAVLQNARSGGSFPRNGPAGAAGSVGKAVPTWGRLLFSVAALKRKESKGSLHSLQGRF